MSDFPTETAKRIARKISLYPVIESIDITGITEEDNRKRNTAERVENLLIEFQRLSVFNTFEDSIEIYEGLKLTDKMIEGLGKIYRITKPWVKGKLADKLLSSMDDAEEKDIPNLVKSIVENMEPLANEGNIEGAKKWKITLNHQQVKPEELKNVS